jgi:FXSXX-COOH protein
MAMRVEKSAGIEPSSTTLLDVTRLPLAELVTSRDTVLNRSIRARLDDIDDDRNPVLSAFGSFISS